MSTTSLHLTPALAYHTLKPTPNSIYRVLYKMVNAPQLKEHFSGDGPPLNDRWSDLWNQGNVPWDQGTHNPALEDTLHHRKDLIGDSAFVEDGKGGRRRKRALVPGCGRGYDVLLLARMGFDAVGLEVSGKAVEEGRAWIGEHKKKDHGGIVGEARIILGDFFNDAWVEEIGCQDGFDLIYDFTFFCALPPTLRPAWAHRHTTLLSKTNPESALICVEFPTTKPLSSGGPPFGSPPAAYEMHLRYPGVEVLYDGEGRPVGKGDTGEGEGVAGLTRVGHWRAERTHEMGKGEDWVGVWKRA